jgi:hypothetical protein
VKGITNIAIRCPKKNENAMGRIPQYLELEFAIHRNHLCLKLSNHKLYCHFLKEKANANEPQRCTYLDVSAEVVDAALGAGLPKVEVHPPQQNLHRYTGRATRRQLKCKILRTIKITASLGKFNGLFFT